MHYYKFNIGDYASHTRHLSLMEDLAYRRLLDLAYTHEKPIVNDMHSISRLIGMREYKQEISDVLKEFFVETDDGWIHERVMREIGITGAKSDSAKKSASHKWGKDQQADNTAKRSERLSAARKIASHTKEEWEALKVICENKCVRCGSVDHIVKDHIIPIYQGGSDGIDNLQPLCKTCNSSKGPEDIDYRPSSWKERLRSQAFLVKTSANTDEMPATHNTLPTTRDTLPETQDTLHIIETSTSLPATPKADRVPYEEIVNLYHKLLPKSPRVALLNSKRKGQIAARWKSGVLPDLKTWEEYFAHISESPFLMGHCDPQPGRKRFVADLEWITNENNFTKIAEGKYHGKV